MTRQHPRVLDALVVADAARHLSELADERARGAALAADLAQARAQFDFATAEIAETAARLAPLDAERRAAHVRAERLEATLEATRGELDALRALENPHFARLDRSLAALAARLEPPATDDP